MRKMFLNYLLKPPVNILRTMSRNSMCPHTRLGAWRNETELGVSIKINQKTTLLGQYRATHCKDNFWMEK